MNLIIADDEPLALIELKTLIPWKDYGFNIVGEARNGRAALELLKNNPHIDLAILDINMPVLTGLEVIEEWRKLEGDTEFLIISAYNDYPLVRKAFKIGTTDYILKEELEPEMLIPIINKIKGIINKKKASLPPTVPVIDNLDERKVVLDFLTAETVKTIPQKLKLKSSSYRLLKLEILYCKNTNREIKTSSLIYLTEQLLLKYHQNNIVIEYRECFYILIIQNEDNIDKNNTISQITKELKNTIKKYLNRAITISGGLSDLTNGTLQSQFRNLAELHQFKSRGVLQSMDFIMNNYKDQEIKLEALCNITGISRSHLSTLFKQETGLGYKEYLNEVRISHAITLLETTDMKVQDICFNVGFLNVEHFSRTFKNRTGLSPSTFTQFSTNKQ